MDSDLDPVVGNWYRDVAKDQMFRVVAVDEDRDLIEIQHFDGDLEEIEFSGWFDLDVEVTEAPEDWTAPLDEVERDDLGYTETAIGDDDWRAGREPARGAKKEDWEEDDEDEDEDDDDDDEDEEDNWGDDEGYDDR